MYTIGQMSDGLRNPNRILLELVELSNRLVLLPEETDVLGEDWDNLVILDACRYDVFKDENVIPGRLESIISKGSSTHEFFKDTFQRESYPEIVYVSANANITLIDSCFHDRIRLWEDDWDPEFDTVPPEAVVRGAISAQDRYPDKRLIIHFMQPHYPFIGKLGQRIEHKGQFEHPETESRIWKKLEAGEYDKETVWKAYRENLNVVLPEVQRLVDELVGNTIITSDHGNEFGWLDLYGHPGNRYTRNLKKVPWLVIEGKQRKEIVPGEASEGPMDKTKSIEEKLEALGYIQG